MVAATVSNTLDVFLDQVRTDMQEALRQGSVYLDDNESARRLANDFLVTALQQQQRLNSRFGAFYTSDRARKALNGISRQALHSRVENHRLLRVTTNDDKKIYPAAQFDQNGALLAGLPKLLKALLPAAADEWVVLYWLTAPLPDFDDRTAFEVLRTGDRKKIKDLLNLATVDAAQWHYVNHDGQERAVENHTQKA